jgi:HEAT repeat protein
VEIPAPDEVGRLILDLQDDRRDIRSRAAYELGKHRDPRTVKPLVAALSDNDKFVRSWAAGALAKTGPKAVEPLLTVLEGPDATASYYAALALGELGDLRAIPMLAAAIRSGDWDIRPSAASALKSFGDGDSLPNRILADPDLTPRWRAEILLALCDVSHSDDEVQVRYHIPDLDAFCKEQSKSVDEKTRSGAVETLQALAARPGPETKPERAAEPPPDAPQPAPTEPAAQAAKLPDVANPAPESRPSLWDRLLGKKDG